MMERGKWDDTLRVLAPIVLGLLLIRWSPDFAKVFGVPEISVVGLYVGWLTIGVGVSHYMRRALFPGLDLRQIMAIAVRDKQAGHVALGVCIVLAALILAAGRAQAAELPPNAVKYLPVLANEQRVYWPDSDLPTLAAQTEQETCLNLKHSRCWSPRAELRTQRERGVGFPQITKTAKFDNLKAMVMRHPRELAGWSWDSPTLYDPVMQARALVLMGRDNMGVAEGAATSADWWAMVLVAHNAGPGRVRSDRRLCAGTPGCDPSRWFGNAENTSLLAKQPLGGVYKKSFFQISREYPRRILFERREKYVGAM